MGINKRTGPFHNELFNMNFLQFVRNCHDLIAGVRNVREYSGLYHARNTYVSYYYITIHRHNVCNQIDKVGASRSIFADQGSYNRRILQFEGPSIQKLGTEEKFNHLQFTNYMWYFSQNSRSEELKEYLKVLKLSKYSDFQVRFAIWSKVQDP